LFKEIAPSQPVHQSIDIELEARGKGWPGQGIGVLAFVGGQEDGRPTGNCSLDLVPGPRNRPPRLFRSLRQRSGAELLCERQQLAFDNVHRLDAAIAEPVEEARQTMGMAAMGYA